MPSQQNKTRPTPADVDAFITAVSDEQKRADSYELIELMQTATGEPPIMWGLSIVGFGSYHYKYKPGREGDMPIVGFSPRKAALSIYVIDEVYHPTEMIKKLGKYTTGKSCLYVKRLTDIDGVLLKELVEQSVANYSLPSNDS